MQNVLIFTINIVNTNRDSTKLASQKVKSRGLWGEIIIFFSASLKALVCVFRRRDTFKVTHQLWP